MSEPTWRLTVAGITAVVVATIACFSEVSAKTDKTEHAALKVRVAEPDKSHALPARDIATIAKGVDELKDMMKEITHSQHLILQSLMEQRNKEYGPPAPGK